MDQWEEFLREFFDKYSSVYTQKQKEEFFDEQIRELPNYYGVKENHDLYNDSILFITGFGALETGQRFEFNESMFNRKLYFNVGKGLETYLAAQRTYNIGWAKESEKRMREAISELTYFQWFPHYKYPDFG